MVIDNSQVGSFMGGLVASSFFLRLLHVAGGAATFFLFASIVFGSTAFIFLAIPETKGKDPAIIAAEISWCENCCRPYTQVVDEGPPLDEASDERPRCPDVDVQPHIGDRDKWL